jgi:hypothetical protein
MTPGKILNNCNILYVKQFPLVILTILLALNFALLFAIIPDKSEVYALPRGSVSGSFPIAGVGGGFLGYPGLPGPGGLPTFGDNFLAKGGAVTTSDSTTSTQQASLHPYRLGANSGGTSNYLRPGVTNYHCTGYGVSINPCNPVDSCLVNPCPMPQCVIEPCPPPYGRIILGDNIQSSSSLTVNNIQRETSSSGNSAPSIVVEQSQPSQTFTQQPASIPRTVSVPIADAGADINANSSDFVVLDGSRSYDTAGYPLSFLWTQLSGPQVVSLSGVNSYKATFTAPNVNQTTILSFRLIVNDGVHDSAPSYVSVTVKP